MLPEPTADEPPKVRQSSLVDLFVRLSVLSAIILAIAVFATRHQLTAKQAELFRPIAYENSSRLSPYDRKLLRQWAPVVLTTSNPSDWPGEDGRPYTPPESQDEQDKAFTLHYFNVLASEKIAINRSVPDKRFKKCLSKVYPETLPSTSVIIVFHNEAWSTLLRTVHSVIRMTPRELLQEILLVDDYSSKGFLKEKLEQYIAHLSESAAVSVKLLRQSERIGLIKARMVGAAEAKGQVLTFLDSHCECTSGWIEPLLSRIVEDRTRVVSPIIDVIDDKTFEYVEASDKVWGGFSWKMMYRWETVPKREDVRRAGDRTVPLRPPTIAGGIFSIDKEYFNYLGKYDEDMKIWGGENVELSMRVWNCGGSLEVVPCARVGHVFRMETPYTMPGGKEKIVNGNTVRIVDLWLDEWMMFFYNLYPYTLEGKEGDVNGRREITKKNNCKGFKYFRETIYPESTFPTAYRYMGQVEHTASYKCLDTTQLTGYFAHKVEATLRHCFWNQHPHLSFQQFVSSTSDEIYHDEFCLDYDTLDEKAVDKSVLLAKCNKGSSQRWDYTKSARKIVHLDTGLCLDFADPKMVLSPCSESRTQKWYMRNNFDWDPPSHFEDDKKQLK